MDDPTPQSADRDEAYLRLLAEHERWLATYVHSLVARPADAADIVQECKLTLWRKFSDFTPGTNFRAWARTVALHQVLNYRRAEQRRPWATADQAFIEAVAAEIERRGDDLEQRADVLRECLRKLPEDHRAVVLARYHGEREIADIAATTGRTAEAVYRLLSRIRAVLNTCISRQLGAAGRGA